MDKPLLNDPEIRPTDQVLEQNLGKAFPAFLKLRTLITAAGSDIEPVWNYYRDGQAWLCKNVFKKKTIFWLSVWDGYAKIGFYFTEKTASGLMDIEIDKSIKKAFQDHAPVGKLLPLVIDLKDEAQIPDVVRIIAYKKSLK